MALGEQKATKRKTSRAKAAPERPFERVWAIVMRVPRGRVVTYGQLSQMIERRLTPIAIGWAIRAAPEGALPWFRVVNANGGVSTDRAHPGLQRSLLEAEGVRFDEDGEIDLARFGWRPSVTAKPNPKRTPRPRVKAKAKTKTKTKRRR